MASLRGSIKLSFFLFPPDARTNDKMVRDLQTHSGSNASRCSAPVKRLICHFFGPVAAIAIVIGFVGGESQSADPVMDLSGQWQVVFDRDRTFDPAVKTNSDGGESNSVSSTPVEIAKLPGSLRDSGLGDLVGPNTKWIASSRQKFWESTRFDPYRGNDNFKLPFWLQPERHYVGKAWYRREINIPATWEKRKILLHLERPHWQTEVWIDDKFAGQNDSLSVPHEYDITSLVGSGKHWLTIGIDNSCDLIDVGIDAHSVSDHTQSAWHGIVGEIQLRSQPMVSVELVKVLALPKSPSVRATVKIGNTSGQIESGRLNLLIEQEGIAWGTASLDIAVPTGGGTFDVSIPWNREPALWDEFRPTLYHLTTSLERSGNLDSKNSTTFGVRSVESRDEKLLLNEHPIFLRGTLECCVFPLTGYPPTDVNAWKRILNICKFHGLNHLRFHSWCPPEAAFVAADEIGFYYQIESSTWPNISVQLGAKLPIDDWLYRESERIIAAYANHPSFLLMVAGNEPSGARHGAEYLEPWVDHFNRIEDRVLFSAGSGWPQTKQSQFHVLPGPRLHQWGHGLRSRINAFGPETITDYRSIVGRHNVPLISHEAGQWCAFPNLDETSKYTGPLKARNLEIFRDLLDQTGMLAQADDFVMASGKLQAICYKEEIESCLRTPGLGGFQLLGLHDFPGQGTATVGILDAFWDPKPYINAGQFRQSCGPITPLARMSKRIWTNNETFVADLEVAQFGPETLADVTPRWTITHGDHVLASGELTSTTIDSSRLSEIGQVEWNLSGINEACELTLTAILPRSDVFSSTLASPHDITNSWNFWVYPQSDSLTDDPDILIKQYLDDQAIERLREGGKVVLLTRASSVKTDTQIGFSPIFWNTAWTNGQAPHTLGILCDPGHPSLSKFPTRFHSDWQWWELIKRSATMELNDLPTDLVPIIQVIPDWYNPKRLALMIEANVEGGKLLICTIDLNGDLSSTTVVRQMRQSLMEYVAGEQFEPPGKLSIEQVRSLFREPSALQKINALVTTDSHQPGHEAEFAIDGNRATIWHTAWSPTVKPLPHWLQIDLREPRRVEGVRCVPRADYARGRIAGYKIMVSEDASIWHEVAVGDWSNNSEAKEILISLNHHVQFVRLVAESDADERGIASLAEFEIVMGEDEINSE